MSNHFHIVLKVKGEEDIISEYIRGKPTRVLSLRRINDKLNEVPLIISRQFSNLFNSYAQAFNKQNNRKGSLFSNRFKRKHIETNEYLFKLIHYVHYNPLCNDITTWKYSSYKAIIYDGFTMIARKQVLELFDGKQNFIYCHKTEPKLTGLE